MTILASVSIWLGVCALNMIHYPLAERFATRLLPPLPLAFFLLGQLLQVVSIQFSSYLRAHKKEPMMSLSVASGILIALSTVILGKYYAAMGVSIGYFLSNIILIPFVFLIWSRCRTQWHGAQS
jgi:hypothetical protein